MRAVIRGAATTVAMLAFNVAPSFAQNNLPLPAVPERISKVSLVLVVGAGGGGNAGVHSLMVGEFDDMLTCVRAQNGASGRALEDPSPVLRVRLYCIHNGRFGH